MLVQPCPGPTAEMRPPRRGLQHAQRGAAAKGRSVFLPSARRQGHKLVFIRAKNIKLDLLKDLIAKSKNLYCTYHSVLGRAPVGRLFWHFSLSRKWFGSNGAVEKARAGQRAFITVRMYLQV